MYQFAIMPDHVHILCKTEDVSPPRGLENPRCGGYPVFRREGFPTCDVKNNISDFIKSIKGTFAGQRGMGIVWQPRFHDEIIQTDEQLETVIHYIQDNPMKAGLPERWQKYPYQYRNLDGLF